MSVRDWFSCHLPATSNAALPGSFLVGNMGSGFWQPGSVPPCTLTGANGSMLREDLPPTRAALMAARALLGSERRYALTVSIVGASEDMDKPGCWGLPEDAVLLERWRDRMTDEFYWKWAHPKFEVVSPGAYATIIMRMVPSA